MKVETKKVNELLNNITTGNIIELKELIYIGSELVCDKYVNLVGNPNKNTKQMGKLTRRTGRETVATGESAEEEKPHENMLEWKDQNKRVDKSYNTTWQHKSKRYHQKNKDSEDTGRCSNNKNKTGARGVMVIVVGNGHGDRSSNPGRDWLHFT